jgi:hypothetical protein
MSCAPEQVGMSSDIIDAPLDKQVQAMSWPQSASFLDVPVALSNAAGPFGERLEFVAQAVEEGGLRGRGRARRPGPALQLSSEGSWHGVAVLRVLDGERHQEGPGRAGIDDERCQWRTGPEAAGEVTMNAPSERRPSHSDATRRSAEQMLCDA